MILVLFSSGAWLLPNTMYDIFLMHPTVSTQIFFLQCVIKHEELLHNVVPIVVRLTYCYVTQITLSRVATI